MVEDREQCCHLLQNKMLATKMVEDREQCCNLPENKMLATKMVEDREQCCNLPENKMLCYQNGRGQGAVLPSAGKQNALLPKW